jgi:SAM-dependent methyltransferase
VDRPDIRKLWELNAPAWIELSRAGFDVYRDVVNTPAFFELLPRVDGLFGLDVGCGEGHNTRLLADRGATVIAVDISVRLSKLPRPSTAPASSSSSATALTSRSEVLRLTSSPRS